jgi:hypothetical protein
MQNGGNGATRLLNGRLETHPRELNITFEPHKKQDGCNFKIDIQFTPTFS